ncbi:Acetoin catabolism regulatory protein [Jannaschia seosinensis]|uniref:Acetoin catabolism regulatory protein n=1 Tax=Jannaschia seosinensis TaxID=313367 RepID=A0A0M7B6I0_9RHOB|nr:sigma 54-interacting transcriptional regulator [Jannaschia seosinensis]CUH20291.1 Acetoin catabolism regulatory protein [Jannaschia seosinensis]
MANLMAESRRDWVLRVSDSPEFLDVEPEAAVRLDGAGRVLGYTRTARRLFPEGAPILGQRIDTVLGLTVDDLPDLMRDRPPEDRIIEMQDGGAIFGHAIAPQAPRTPPREARSGGALAGLAGGDPAMTQVLAQAAKLARSSVPLLLTGETGTGKTRLAGGHTAGTVLGLLNLNCAGLTRAALREACHKVSEPTTRLLRRFEELPEDVADTLAALLDGNGCLRPVSTSCDAPWGYCPSGWCRRPRAKPLA